MHLHKPNPQHQKGWTIVSKNSTPAANTPAAENENTPIVVPVRVSAAFKAALDAYAEQNDVTVASLARKAIAAVIGYDIGSEPETARKSKFETPFGREYARLLNLRRATERNKALLQAHKARIAGKKDAAAKYDAIVASCMDGTWLPDDAGVEKLRKAALEKLTLAELDATVAAADKLLAAEAAEVIAEQFEPAE